ncbi:MAG: FAD:protein FMN transferase [Proteobacteria bacterium]|nr:FAD:protein FMN transferase [Pseudomonadota bacterium]MDA0928950.1 FAD:protein FMN transferase [Pseudomonadota bacterium]
MIEILRQHTFSITFVVILFSYFLFEGANNDDLQVLNGFTMGTTYQVQLPELPSGRDREQLGTEINELLQRLDRGIFSTYAPDSELSRLNRHPVGTPFIASAEMIEVMAMAQQVSVLSDGAFDVTVGPLVNLWGFGPEISAFSENIPADDALQEALQNVGYRHVVVNASTSEIVRNRDVYVDLSAIAKGYAVDELAELLDELGADSYFLEIGGELKIKGLKPGGESWVPAIEAPVDTASRIYEIFYSRGETIGIAGSGDYRNYFEEEGVRYSHEIDPRTGRPITHHLAAAYVIDESAAMADALATAYMILGLDAALSLAQRRSQAAYLIYKTDNGFDEVITDPFNKYLAQN